MSRRYTRQGHRLPADVQLTARERPDGSGVDVAVFSDTPSASSRRRQYPPAERVEALEVARDARGLLTLRDAVLADMRDGTLHADDATTGGNLLAAIEQALLRLARAQETVNMSDRPGSRHEGQNAPLAQRVADAKDALHGVRPPTFGELGTQRLAETQRALRGEHQHNTDADLQRRVSDAKRALRGGR